MFDFLKSIKKAKMIIEKSESVDILESLRKEFLGKQGLFNRQIQIVSNSPLEERAKKYAIINKNKQDIERLFVLKRNFLQSIAIDKQIIDEQLDISLPGRRPVTIGRLHPITSTIDRVVCFFKNMGFSITYGPEIEDSYHNFDSLNIPNYHPARDAHDTFWINETCLLRTQTSGIQVRVMQENTPPIRIIAPGRVYRKDYDKYHTPMFHQVEGLVVDKDISFKNLKCIMHDFLYDFFVNMQSCIKIRFRPSYFPFTEPSAEIDIMLDDHDWLEILGCGMVHPNVLLNVDIDPEVFSGFAFGVGIERLAMLYYGVVDLRSFFENDIRFLKQFIK